MRILYGRVRIDEFSGEDRVVVIGLLESKRIICNELVVTGLLRINEIHCERILIRGRGSVKRIQSGNILIQSIGGVLFIDELSSSEAYIIGKSKPVVINNLHSRILYAEYSLINKAVIDELLVLNTNTFIRELVSANRIVFLDPYTRFEHVRKITGEIIYRYSEVI